MLPKNRKLNRQDIIFVTRNGKLLKEGIFNIKYQPNTIKTSRFSVVVSKKVFLKSYLRNRLKRLTYTHTADFLNPYDVIITFNKSVVNLSREEISTQINQVLSKISLI